SPSCAPTQLYTLSLHDALPISSSTLICFTCQPLSSICFCSVSRGCQSATGSLQSLSARAVPAIKKEAKVMVRVFFMMVLLVGFRSEEHTSELQSRENLVCRLLL